MPWLEHHKLSERLASEAQVALLRGRPGEALELYAGAADAEVKALADLDRSKVRTTGISAVSAASLYYKAADLERSEEVAARWLGEQTLPDFAKKQLRCLLRAIWSQVPAAAGGHGDGRLRAPTNVKTAPNLNSGRDLEDALTAGAAAVQVVSQTMQSMKDAISPSDRHTRVGSNFEGNLELAEAAIAEVRKVYDVVRNAGALE